MKKIPPSTQIFAPVCFGVHWVSLYIIKWTTWKNAQLY